MIDRGRHSILGVKVSAVDYEYTVGAILSAAERRAPLAVSALAVHGVMTGYQDPVHRRRLNGLDILAPDGQPVRWALQWLHGVRLEDRVYGPDLVLHTAQEFARRGWGVYLYGTTSAVLGRFADNLRTRFPGLVISGMEPSRFRRLNENERAEVVDRINASGARAVLVGLGCPRQEAWAFEHRRSLPMPILAVGAAFDFHAGTLSQAPAWMQRRGLEWLYRLSQEPGRLWHRYLVLNPLYLWGVARQRFANSAPEAEMPTGSEPVEAFG
jgi:N-acetylglucosaminyldiphosphoundecaprenol N-acetyl-beta-D-mannosaminyltransferase